jgi:ABC-type transporter Mla MlaB component
MGRYMARKKNKAAAGTRAPERPRIAAAAAATNTMQSDAAPTGAASAGGSGLMVLGSSLSIREVGERAAQFKALIASGSAEVDAGKLESIDTAGLQLLLAAAAAARRRGLTLRLHGAGSLGSGAASALGLADHLAATAEILP